ncbi:hypothetical protein BDZ91DRAFT_716389 [Kalaharituber pfeilii]|nr:hypothetical protein BDZ91DRAFT_716389 [Kalaharituber pfeilii]
MSAATRPITIALAGGTFSIALHILNALLKSPHNFQVLLLTRAARPDPSSPQQSVFKVPNFPLAEHPNLTISYSTPYDRVEQLSLLFRSHNVHTVVSAIGSMENLQGLRDSQINLYEAAKQSDTVKRFVPSEWEGSPSRRSKGNESEFGYFGIKNEVLDYIIKDILSGKGLEVGYFIPGVFMDYFSKKYFTDTSEEGGKGYLPDIGFPFLVDFKARVANFPAHDDGQTGDWKVRWTFAQDVGKFTALVLGEENWNALSSASPVKPEKPLYEFRIGTSRTSATDLIGIGTRLPPGTPLEVLTTPIAQLAAEAAQAMKNGDVYTNFEKEALVATGKGIFDWDDSENLESENIVLVNVKDVWEHEHAWQLEEFLQRWGP